MICLGLKNQEAQAPKVRSRIYISGKGGFFQLPPHSVRNLRSSFFWQFQWLASYLHGLSSVELSHFQSLSVIFNPFRSVSVTLTTRKKKTGVFWQSEGGGKQRLIIFRCFFAPPSTRNRRSQIWRFQLFFPRCLSTFTRFRLIFCHFRSVSVNLITFNQFQSVSISLTRWKTQEFIDNRKVEKTTPNHIQILGPKSENGRPIFYHYWCWRAGGAAPVKTSTGKKILRKMPENSQKLLPVLVLNFGYVFAFQYWYW